MKQEPAEETSQNQRSSAGILALWGGRMSRTWVSVSDHVKTYFLESANIP